MKVKVCGMREKENIEHLVQCNPDFIGFIFYPKSKRYVGKKLDATILDTIPLDVIKVGVFVNEDFETMLNIARENLLDMVQLHGNEDAGYCQEARNNNLLVSKAFSISDDAHLPDFEAYKEVVDYYLFDTKSAGYGGSGRKFNWQVLENKQFSRPVIISGGIGEEDVPELKKLDKKVFQVADINSRFELEPAKKNIEIVREFIRSLKNE